MLTIFMGIVDSNCCGLIFCKLTNIFFSLFILFYFMFSLIYEVKHENGFDYSLNGIAR